MKVSCIPRAALLVALLSITSVYLFAQAGNSADPFTSWDYSDNPAAIGFFPDTMTMGIRRAAAVEGFALNDGFPGTFELLYGLKGLSYRFKTDGVANQHLLTSASSFGKVLSLGIRFRWDETSSLSPLGFYGDTGLIIRPLNFLSLALATSEEPTTTAKPAFSHSMAVAIRPLAFDPALESMLTLGADARYSGGTLSFDSISARLVLDSWLSVHGRYSLSDSSFGIGLALALSGSEMSAAYFSPGGGAALSEGIADIGASIRIGRAMKSTDRLLSPSVLLIDEPGIWAEAPPSMDFDPGFGNDVALWFGQAISAIDKAAMDRSIGFLVMVEPPLFMSEARAQEMSRTLARFRAAGKPVYVYARSMNRLSYVYVAAGAELVALDPNGSLPIVDVAGFSFYLKDALSRLGVETYNLQSHDTKTAFNMFSESGMVDAERAMVRRYVTGLAGQGYAELESARGDKLKVGAITAIAAGPYIDPCLAVEAGLVDALMYRDEFDELVQENTGSAPMVDIRSYARERSLSWGLPMAKKVAVVYLSGNIIEGPGVRGMSIGDSAAELLASLREEPGIAGVLLRVDSGGGSVITSDHIAREVRRLKESGKPVVVSMAGYAASGGYYISAYADKILAEAGTITGAIGVTGINFNAAGLLERLGIGTGVESAGQSGEFGNIFLPHRDRDTATMKAGILYAYDRFIDVVASGRNIDRTRADELGKGQIWLGREALEAGLIDAIGGMDEAKEALAELLGHRIRCVEYLPGELDPKSLFSLLGVSSVSLPASIAGIVDFAEELSELGGGLLYMAPEYLYRER